MSNHFSCMAVCTGLFSVTIGYHRLLSKRFPFAIYYRMQQPDLIVVYRVLDCRRDPEKIRGSLHKVQK